MFLYRFFLRYEFFNHMLLIISFFFFAIFLIFFYSSQQMMFCMYIIRISKKDNRNLQLFLGEGGLISLQNNFTFQNKTTKISLYRRFLFLLLISFSKNEGGVTNSVLTPQLAILNFSFKFVQSFLWNISLKELLPSRIGYSF